MPKISTREKIITAAKNLFGDHGFKGTSIRMIADKAKVNVASINYYFTSKDALFYDVIIEEALDLGKEMTTAYQESEDFVSMSVNLFNKLYKRAQQTRNCMKMMMSVESLPAKNGGLNEQQRMVIRGVHSLFEDKIIQECGPRLKRESAEWAADMMMILVLQTAMMGSSVFIQNIKPEKDFSKEALVFNVKRLAEAILADLNRELE